MVSARWQFIILKGAVPKELTRDARERVAGLRAAGGTNDFQQGFQFFATTPECQQGFVNMFEGSRLAECLRELIGPFSPIIACDAHNTPGSDDADFVSGDQGEMGHIDGQMAPPPQCKCSTPFASSFEASRAALHRLPTQHRRHQAAGQRSR